MTNNNPCISRRIINETVSNLTTKFHHCWNYFKCNSSKLSFYNQIKINFKREAYLDDIAKFNHRSALTKLRISAHDLKIETGRYKQQIRETRTCDWCQIVMNTRHIEDEKHVLLDCDLYNSHRRAFTNSTPAQVITEPSSNPSTPISIQQFLTSNTEKSHNIKLSKAVFNMFRTREKFIESLKINNLENNNT